MNMEDNLSLQNCGEDDVISLCHQLFKFEYLKFTLKNQISSYNIETSFSNSLKIDINSKHRCISAIDWFENGVNCEVLKIGSQGWRKGKVKINIQVSLEFCPDEPEIEQINHHWTIFVRP
ncbi:hypothetical protein H6G17_12150 [Chroococcidiopsis sp. FACHB-1243]|nr:hypothetical protein [Chroococcidiopsis sp. [FACHB-1243]]